MRKRFRERVDAVLAEQESGTTEVAWMFDGEREPTSLRVGEDSASDAPYPIYSITKTMIATIFLALQEVGRLHLDAPLSDWFPDLPSAEKISLRMLLNHSSGYGDYGQLKEYHADLAAHPSSPWTYETYLERTVFRFGTHFPPGTEYRYSNPAYMILGRLLSEVTEMTLKELIDYWIATPLGLSHTSVAESLDDMSGLTPALSGTLSMEEELKSVPLNYHPGWVSHGLVLSTPKEIVRFFAALRGGKIITHGSFDEMLQTIPVPDDSARWAMPGYGLGMMADPHAAWGRFYGHGGGGPGYTLFAGRWAEIGLDLCVVRAAGIVPGDGAEEILDALL